MAEFFAKNYAEAREGFLAAVSSRGLRAESASHPSRKGAKGEDLAMDSVLLGPADAASLLIVTSGTHGVEGVKFYTRTKVVTTRWPHQDTPAPGFNMPTLG